MPLLHSVANPWLAECELLQCVSCAGPLESADDDALACHGCGRRYPIRHGVLETMQSLRGNNKVAADFYNGPLWPCFRFWERVTWFCNGGERRARGHIMKHLPDLSGTRLLEVAVGDGSNLPLIPEDCRVFGNDISPVQLGACHRRFPQRDLRLVLGEAEGLPFRDRTFDNVLSVGAFNYFNDPLKALKEMARVCKPGGRVVVSDELPSLPNRMLGYWVGLPQLDRWVMSRLLKLGPDFTDLVDKHRNLKLEPIVREALDHWQIHSLWFKIGYCIVGRPKG